MTDQVIYSMVRVGRMVPPNKMVLRDISLGFFYGAKIGVTVWYTSYMCTLKIRLCSVSAFHNARALVRMVLQGTGDGPSVNGHVNCSRWAG